MIQNMKEEIIKLKNELKRYQSDAKELDKNKEILADLYYKKVIDEFGNLL